MKNNFKTEINKLTPILYNASGFPMELEALQVPLNFESVFIDDINVVLKKNPLIYTNNITILMPTSSFFEKQFKNTLLDMYIFRKEFLREKNIPFSLYIEELFVEYLIWLNTLKQQHPNWWDNNDHQEFLLYYNKRFFPKFINDHEMKKNTLKMNPFIMYWYHCNLLRLTLKISVNTCFIPCAKPDDTFDSIFDRFKILNNT